MRKRIPFSKSSRAVAALTLVSITSMPLSSTVIAAEPGTEPQGIFEQLSAAWEGWKEFKTSDHLPEFYQTHVRNELREMCGNDSVKGTGNKDEGGTIDFDAVRKSDEYGPQFEAFLKKKREQAAAEKDPTICFSNTQLLAEFFAEQKGFKHHQNIRGDVEAIRNAADRAIEDELIDQMALEYHDSAQAEAGSLGSLNSALVAAKNDEVAQQIKKLQNASEEERANAELELTPQRAQVEDMIAVGMKSLEAMAINLVQKASLDDKQVRDVERIPGSNIDRFADVKKVAKKFDEGVDVALAASPFLAVTAREKNGVRAEMSKKIWEAKEQMLKGKTRTQKILQSGDYKSFDKFPLTAAEIEKIQEFKKQQIDPSLFLQSEDPANQKVLQNIIAGREYRLKQWTGGQDLADFPFTDEEKQELVKTAFDGLDRSYVIDRLSNGINKAIANNQAVMTDMQTLREKIKSGDIKESERREGYVRIAQGNPLIELKVIHGAMGSEDEAAQMKANGGKKVFSPYQGLRRGVCTLDQGFNVAGRNGTVGSFAAGAAMAMSPAVLAGIGKGAALVGGEAFGEMVAGAGGFALGAHGLFSAAARYAEADKPCAQLDGNLTSALAAAAKQPKPTDPQKLAEYQANMGAMIRNADARMRSCRSQASIEKSMAIATGAAAGIPLGNSLAKLDPGKVATLAHRMNMGVMATETYVASSNAYEVCSESEEGMNAAQKAEKKEACRSAVLAVGSTFLNMAQSQVSRMGAREWNPTVGTAFRKVKAYFNDPVRKIAKAVNKVDQADVWAKLEANPGESVVIQPNSKVAYPQAKEGDGQSIPHEALAAVGDGKYRPGQVHEESQRIKNQGKRVYENKSDTPIRLLTADQVRSLPKGTVLYRIGPNGEQVIEVVGVNLSLGKKQSGLTRYGIRPTSEIRASDLAKLPKGYRVYDEFGNDFVVGSPEFAARLKNGKGFGTNRFYSKRPKINEGVPSSELAQLPKGTVVYDRNGNEVEVGSDKFAAKMAKNEPMWKTDPRFMKATFRVGAEDAIQNAIVKYKDFESLLKDDARLARNFVKAADAVAPFLKRGPGAKPFTTEQMEAIETLGYVNEVEEMRAGKNMSPQLTPKLIKIQKRVLDRFKARHPKMYDEVMRVAPGELDVAYAILELYKSRGNSVAEAEAHLRKIIVACSGKQ